MGFFKPPTPMAPNDVANNQLAYSEDAASQQQKTNMINQQTPFGSLQYSSDPNAPGGYSANVSLSPAQQNILDQLQGSKANVGGAANQLTSNFASMYGQPPNIDPSTLTNKVMGWGQDYMQPIFNMQQSNLDAKLRNQGITPGSEAWNNAQNLQSRNVNNAYTNLMLQAEPTAFSQAMQEYQLPMQTAYGLMNAGQPTSPSFQSTPTAQIQPPNYGQAAQNYFQGSQQNYQNLMQGLGQLTGVGLASNLTGGNMFGGGGAGMFGGGWSGGNMGGTGGALGGLF